MKYDISPQARQHVSNHFGKQEKAGSYFYPEVFSNVDELLQLIENRDPLDIVLQSSGSEAHIYDLTDIGECGGLGLGFKAEYPNRFVFTESRNDFIVSYAKVDELPATSMVTVICSRVADAFQIITVFPGGYAPAFPHDGMAPEDLSRAMAFWDKHILLKKA